MTQFFNLSEGTNVREAEEKIAAYQKANYDNIAYNQARQAEAKRRKAEGGSKEGAADGPAAQIPMDANVTAMQYAATGEPVAGFAMPAPLPVAAGGIASHGEHARSPGNEMASLSPTERQKRVGLASGWRDTWPRHRALQEAFCSVLVH
eukprot:jgi/Botrbrau1/18497/Bobra.0072s0076.1